MPLIFSLSLFFFFFLFNPFVKRKLKQIDFMLLQCLLTQYCPQNPNVEMNKEKAHSLHMTDKIQRCGVQCATHAKEEDSDHCKLYWIWTNTTFIDHVLNVLNTIHLLPFLLLFNISMPTADQLPYIYIQPLKPKFEILSNPSEKMMDHFFDYGHQHEMFWFEYPPMNSNPPTQEFHSENSAFAPYRSQPIPGDGGVGGSNRRNMNSRMMELLRGNWSAIRNSGESDRGRSYRHMMRERARRENQKQSYLALHSLLPHGTKVFD